MAGFSVVPIGKTDFHAENCIQLNACGFVATVGRVVLRGSDRGRVGITLKNGLSFAFAKSSL